MPRITADERARFHARQDECIDKLNSEKNSYKPHWSFQFNEQLFDHLMKEMIELHEAIVLNDKLGIEDESKDVVNISLMIFDNTRGNR